jgi:hypothetical protein
MQRNSASYDLTRTAETSTVKTSSAKARSPLWRAVVGGVVAYALVITALLSGVIQAEWAALAAAGLLGEHCATDARAAGVDPASPAGEPRDFSHCALCTLATGPAVLPVAPAFAFILLQRDAASPGGSDRDLPHWSGHPGKLPRGPPPAVAAA